MVSNCVLLVSEDVGLRDSLSKLVEATGAGFAVHPLVRDWLAATEPADYFCVIVDMEIGDLDSPDRLNTFAEHCANRLVLVITRHGDVPMAVLAVKHGAAEVLQKPLRMEKLLERIQSLRTRGKHENGRAAH